MDTLDTQSGLGEEPVEGGVRPLHFLLLAVLSGSSEEPEKGGDSPVQHAVLNRPVASVVLET